MNNYVYNSEHPNKDQYAKVIEDAREKGYAVFDVLPFRRKINGKRLSDSGFIACLECLAEYNRKRWASLLGHLKRGVKGKVIIAYLQLIEPLVRSQTFLGYVSDLEYDVYETGAYGRACLETRISNYFKK